MEKDVKEKLFAIFPRFVHLQPVTMQGCAPHNDALPGLALVQSRLISFVKMFELLRFATYRWLEVETKEKTWDPRWFITRDQVVCIHESDTHTEPTSVFPCAVRYPHVSQPA